MKKTDIDSEKMRSLINNHSVQIIKPPASAAIPPSANLVNKNNKQKSDEGQFRDQFNKRQQINCENQESKNSENEFTKKYNYYNKTDHLEKNC